MKILIETKSIEVEFPSGNIRRVELDLNTGEFKIALVTPYDDKWSVLSLRNHSNELAQIATLVKDQLNMVKGYEFNEDVEAKEEPSREEWLKAIYFGFYDKMEEPERSQAKANWDYEWAKCNGIPISTSDAICKGFRWRPTTQTDIYWVALAYNKYATK